MQIDVEKLKSWLKSNWYIALAVLIIVPLCGFLAMLHVRGDNRDFAVQGKHLIIVKEGMTTADIAQLLHDKKLVKDPVAFRLEARYKGLATKLQAGPYQIDGGLNNGQIVDVMVKGRIKLLRFTVPEGYTVVKTAKKLEAEGLGNADKFIAAAKNYAPYDYMQTDDPNVKFKAEGFIFPATYDLPVGISEEKMLAIFVSHFDQYMQEHKIKSICAERGLKLRDVVNMAAMVELEAVFAEEQPRIAGVFLKRVEIGMPIQSDTTIQYLFGEQKEIVTFDDLKIDSPYNTYKNAGLPPGPIGSPGISAIKAVLEPEKTDYLYFVAEKDGHHRFTKTYSEHLRAIEEIG
ncbi:MAG: endolytic transglycosylase MltG [Phascolarctobacterium sp.]|nr:endolytic transglycosylase MltG [Phascolarctobacterium sp.]